MKNFKLVILSLGWVLLAIFLGSGYVMNKFKSGTEKSNFMPVTWDEHLSVFEGALSCSLRFSCKNFRIYWQRKTMLSFL